MSKIHLGPGFSLPAEAAADVIAIVGRRGRGKTTTATVLVEELHAAGERFVVADPVGVWWGLKSSRDGKTQGIPVVVMGGDRGDVPLEDTAGTVIADFVADPSSPSVVLDFRAFRKGQITRFMTAFLEQLYHRNRAPLHIVLDEADQFAPQRFTGDVARLVGAAEDVCKMGRARGLHPIVITQRPAALNKNVLTQAGILIAHGITGPQDIKAVEAWIHERADEDRRAEVLSSLPGLKRGEAWVWAPELEILKQVQVRDRKTFDSSATPKGTESKGPRVLAEVDLDALKVRIASTIERAKAEDPKELRKTITDLQRQVRTLQNDVEKKHAVVSASKPEVSRPVLKDAQVKRLEAAAARIDRAMVQLGKWAQAFTGTEREVRNVGAEISAALAAARAPADAGASTWRSERTRPAPGATATAVATPHSPRREPTRVGDGSGLGSGERAVLTAVAQHQDGVTREQLSVLTGYKRSSRDTYLQRLRAGGYVDDNQAYRLVATWAGVAALGPDFEPLPTGDALREHWRARLPEGERRVFEVVVSAYPQALERAALDDATGYRRSSRDTYLQRLSARKLVVPVGRGAVRAAEELFG